MDGYAGNIIIIEPEISKIAALHLINYKDKKSHKYYYDFKKMYLMFLNKLK